MTDLIELLRQFNRKERFFLVGRALDNEKFRLSKVFRKKLADAIELDVEIPCDAFAAMDYHLNWVAGSIAAYRRPECKTFPKPDKKAKKATDIDTDLLIAFKSDSSYHIIFIEAKGYDSWKNKQMNQKTDLLRNIFEQDEDNYPKVNPHFCLTSPRPPQKLEPKYWSYWTWKKEEEGEDRYYWMKLCLPNCRQMVTAGCDCNNGTSVEKDHFHIVDA